MSPPPGFVPETTASAPPAIPAPAGFVPEGQASQQSQPTSATPQLQFSWTPTPEPTGLPERLERWSQNVSSDLSNGTDLTGVGAVLKAMGAHGLNAGTSPAVAEFMGSLPLGLLQAGKGAAQVYQPGKGWTGVKNITGGLLQASTMPGMVVAPEAGEMAGTGLDAAASTLSTQAGNAATAIKTPFDASTIQPELQAGIRNAINAAAKELGVQPSSAASIRDVASEISTRVKAQSQSIYKTLDNATQGRFQRFDDALDDIHSQLRDLIDGEDPDHEGALIERLNTVQDAKDRAIEGLRAAGIDTDSLDKANALWKRGSALGDLAQHIRTSTSGMRPELAVGKTSPETVSATKLFTRANSLYDRGRLQVALGVQKAQELLQTADMAFLQAQKVENAQAWLKTAAKIGSGAVGGYGAYLLVNHLLGN